jgi:AAA+ ATPase superfamily predicted ATPase
MLPALPRLPDVKALIKKEEYFVLHAPRQSGKTTSIKAFVNEINKEGQYYALYCSLEELRANFDFDIGIKLILNIIKQAMTDSNIDALMTARISIADSLLASPDLDMGLAIRVILKAICSSLDKELVFFLMRQTASKIIFC